MTATRCRSASPDMPMDRALLIMTEKRFGCLGVTGADGRLVGIVTDGDLRRHMGPDLLARPVADIMTPDPRTIAPDALAAEALHAMNARARPITALFVADPAAPPDRYPARARPAARRSGVMPRSPRSPHGAAVNGSSVPQSAGCAGRRRLAASPVAG